MSPAQVQKRIGQELSREEPLSFTECNSALLEVVGALTEVGDRVSRITPGGDGGRTPAGIEYKRALQTGTAEDVRKLNDEFKVTSVLLAQLKAQRDELHNRRLDARFREARHNLPGLQSALIKHLEDVERAKADLDRKVATLVDAGSQIEQARSIIRERHQGPDVGATVKTLQRLNELGHVLPGGISRHPNWWIDTVGCAVTARVYQAATIKAPDADYSECETDAAVMRKAVETIFGTRSEDDAEIAHAFSSLPANAKERIAA